MFLVRGQTTAGGALLRRGRLHADHGDGPGHPPAHPSALSPAGRATWGMSGATFAAVLAAAGLRRPDRRQMGGGRLGRLDLLHHAGRSRPTACCSRRSATAIPSRSTASCARKRACRAPWLPSSNGSRSRCRNTATPSWSAIARFFELFGVRRPVRYEPAGRGRAIMTTPCMLDLHTAPSILAPYLSKPPRSR